MMVLGPASWEGLHMQLRETNHHGPPGHSSKTKNHHGAAQPFIIWSILGGVKPVHTPPLRKLHIPSKVYVFLWLLSKNYILIKDNVGHMLVALSLWPHQARTWRMMLVWISS